VQTLESIINHQAAAVEQLGALSMDDLLLETFLNAALSSLADEKSLPLDAADCYQKHMQVRASASPKTSSTPPPSLASAGSG
jgi:hypothetical protein